ncbi:hypothetical protein [Azorhizobium caulinodans]|uniref:hypothetical protein n=1 Tax=Azorhizobium caulinodans TaxID=7 RepID=UPI002FBE1000
MATAYVEYGQLNAAPVAGYQTGSVARPLFGTCIATEALTIAGTASTGTVTGAATKTVARITADTACFFAIGTTPNPAATAANGAVTGSKRYLPAGQAVEVILASGAKVAVIAIS